MVFSSATFLFAFLPIVISVYFLINKKFQNLWILLSSLVFYAWSNPKCLWILLLSIALNYVGGLLIDYSKRDRLIIFQKPLLIFIIICNIGLLFYFKYFNFTVQIINDILHKDLSSSVLLPIGISFFTFQSMSYVIDVYRNDTPCQRNITNFAMYVSMFPQLVAGPIVRYRDINKQINSRQVSIDCFCVGASRFTVGLAKKILIADRLAKTADGIFNMNYSYLSGELAWIGIIAYTLQIYFDFSGYSDMAIGLGKIIGFDFVENFNYPYISKSISEFWRRWHISLSSFFRDYVYIPLGGNRKAIYRNIAIVFLLTGMWHGANYTFILWGLWHGLFNIVERPIVKKYRDKTLNKSALLGFLCRIYTLSVVMIGWVFFRSSNIKNAIDYIETMFCAKTTEHIVYTPAYYLNRETLLILILGVLGSTPAIKILSTRLKNKISHNLYIIFKYAFCLILVVLCMLRVVSNTYSAFIYFQF